MASGIYQYCEYRQVCSVYQRNIYRACPWICSGCRFRNLILYSWFITGFVTRVPRLVVHDLLTISERPSFLPFQSAWASYHFRPPELLTISECLSFLPFQSVWATYHFRAPELLTISEHLSFLPFQSAWASCHFRAPELLTISEHLSCLPFQSAWAAYHFRAPELLIISERLSFLPFQSAWASYHFRAPELNPVLNGVRVVQTLFVCVVICRPMFIDLLFFVLVIVFSVVPRLTSSDYPFGIS